jgi:DNA-binding LacI/PurR family transcriptional regulator
VSQVTIRGIAEATGLSIGTVSRALKNQAGMTEETRARCAPPPSGWATTSRS